MLVALLFLNRQGLLVPPFRRLKIPLLLGNHAQLMVGTGRAMLVALLFLNRQGLLVPLFRRLKIPLLLGNPAQLVERPCHDFRITPRFSLFKQVQVQPARL